MDLNNFWLLYFQWFTSFVIPGWVKRGFQQKEDGESICHRLHLQQIWNKTWKQFSTVSFCEGIRAHRHFVTANLTTGSRRLLGQFSIFLPVLPKLFCQIEKHLWSKTVWRKIGANYSSYQNNNQNPLSYFVAVVGTAIANYNPLSLPFVLCERNSLFFLSSIKWLLSGSLSPPPVSLLLQQWKRKPLLLPPGLTLS